MNDNSIEKTLEEIKNIPLKERTVKEEYRLAKQEQRQPNCIYCGEPLVVRQTNGDWTTWYWDEDEKKYCAYDSIDQCDACNADEPCCDSCEARDSDFIDGDLVHY